MKNLDKWLLLVIVAMSLLSGCATVMPIRDLVSTGSPDASRISITSINEANIFDKNSVLPGKIYIDSVFYGEFSKNQREFAAEVLPGTHLIVICPEHDNKCINSQINVQPNKNYKYKYTLASDFMVLWAKFVWKLVPLGVDEYRPIANNASVINLNNSTLPPNSNVQNRDVLVNPQIKPTVNTFTEVETKMEAAKERCSTLGFQVGTQSFGECILRLSK